MAVSPIGPIADDFRIVSGRCDVAGLTHSPSFAAMAQGTDDDRRGQRQLRVQLNHRFYLLCGATVMCHVTSTSTSLDGSEGSTTTTPEMWMVCSPTDSGASRRA